MQMCPEEDYSTIVETLAIDDNNILMSKLPVEIKDTKIMNTSQLRKSLKEWLFICLLVCFSGCCSLPRVPALAAPHTGVVYSPTVKHFWKPAGVFLTLLQKLLASLEWQHCTHYSTDQVLTANNYALHSLFYQCHTLCRIKIRPLT